MQKPTHVWSRRQFTGTAALLGIFSQLPPRALANMPITAEAVVDLIKEACSAQGILWMDQTVDTFKLGDPKQRVTGIVSSFTASLQVMQAAVDAGANFIVSHEPIFYNHLDETQVLEKRDDPVYRTKVQFAETHGLVVWRFHDHLHRITPEPMTQAFYRQLGWETYLDMGQGFHRRINLPPVTLRELATQLTEALPTASIRVIGNPGMTVSRVGQSGHSIGGLIRCYEDCDIGLGAEVREWDSGEYARDAQELGMPKALIMIAHERGEQGGMAVFVDWLNKAVDETVPVSFISSGEPFRTI